MGMQVTGRAMAIVGGGSIGVAFALVFARAGWQVRIQDPARERCEAIAAEVSARLALLQAAALVEDATGIAGRISATQELAAAVQGAELAIECIPEVLELKREVFAALDALASPDAILCSASSALTMSSVGEGLSGRHRCLVAHPGNPPYLIPVVELVPAPFTDAAVVRRCQALFAATGMRPVLVQREVEGFVFNRLQGALLREAYCLVRDGVAGVEDIDTIVRDGLGLRWSVVGPFETADLNTRGGIASHAQKMGPAYARMGAERGQHDPWTPALVQEVVAQRRALLPLEAWPARVEWRDRQLVALVAARQARLEAD